MKKTKDIFKIILVLFIIFAIIYSLISLIVSIFDEPEIISTDELQLYLINDNVVTNYQTYYYIEKCFKNLVEGTKLGRYDEIYKLYINDYKDQYTEEEVYAKLKEFSINSEHCKLQKIYKIDTTYILEYKMKNNVQYLFMQIGASKGESYNFAFVK